MTTIASRGFHLYDDQSDGRSFVEWFGLLALCNLVLLAIRFAALNWNATDLFFDEAQYWAWSEEPAFGYYSKPPLIAWLIGLATSVCGQSTACIRSPSPVVYALASFGVFIAAYQLYGARTAFLSALVFLTLPGVTLSSGIISTDVPLLAAWAFALAAFIALVKGAGWWAAIALGVAIGVGLNGKYAMAYFVLCAVIYGIANPGGRWIVVSPRFWLAIAIAAAMIVPNILWNLDNGFATFSHTADNANWQGDLGNPEKALEFFGAQFGVFGPVLFAGLLIICWRAWKAGLSEPDALLLAFAIPVILIVTTQAFISRAHANWAAVSYVAATVLVTATMVRDLSWRWLSASLALHTAVLAGLVGAVAVAGQFALPGGADPFKRTLGWSELSTELDAKLETLAPGGQPVRAILTDRRAMSAELLYYLRDSGIDILAWRGPRPPKDHFALTRPFASAQNRPDPIVLVSQSPTPPETITAYFRSVTPIDTIEVTAGLTGTRRAYLYRLEGFKGF